MNSLMMLIALLGNLLFSNIAWADRVPGLEAKPLGDLALEIVASDSAKYINEWIDTPPNHGIRIKPLTTAKPDQLIVAAFLVTGYTPDKDGIISLRVSFALIDPNGKELFGQKHFAGVSGMAPEKPSFVMADPALDIMLDNSDPEGEYTIIGIVDDLVSMKSVKSKYIIKLTK